MVCLTREFYYELLDYYWQLKQRLQNPGLFARRIRVNQKWPQSWGGRSYMRRKYRCSFDRLIVASLANVRRGLFKEQYTKNTNNQPDKFEDCIVLETKFIDPIGFTKIKKKTGLKRFSRRNPGKCEFVMFISLCSIVDLM